MLRLINDARRAAGASAVTLDDALSKVARDHAADMIAENRFSHVSAKHGTLASRLHVAKIEYERAGENLAGDVSVSHAFELWMKSSCHKANIMGNWQKVGLGVVKGGSYGLMIVALFAR